MSPSSSLFLSSLLLFLFLLFAEHIPSAAAPKSSAARTKSSAAHLLNKARRDKQAKEYLHAHNAARRSSGASNLKWNKGLARFANKWAQRRRGDCRMNHSGGPYGENIFWYRRNHKKWSPSRVVAKWMEESLNYDRMTNTCQSGKMCGHYTQIVWRKTTAVGCSTVKCLNNRGFLVVCEYSPCGNYEGESPFDIR